MFCQEAPSHFANEGVPGLEFRNFEILLALLTHFVQLSGPDELAFF